MDRAPPLRAEKSTTWARGVINEAKGERDECKHEAECATVASAVVVHMAAGATEAAYGKSDLPYGNPTRSRKLGRTAE